MPHLGDPRDLIHGGWKGELVRAVVELGVPDYVGDGACGLTELAAAVGADEDRLERLLRLATALGLLTASEHPVRYRNNAVSHLLRRDVPGSMRVDAMHVLAPWAALAWDALPTAVMTGKSGFESFAGQGVFAYLQEHPDQGADFDAFQGSVTQRNVQMLQRCWQPPPDARIVDVGGGNGQLLAMLLSQRPDVRGIVADRPDAVRQVQARVTADPRLRGRLSGVEANFFKEVPAGADVYVLSHILHDWDDRHARTIVQTVATAMPSHGQLIILENVDDDPDALLVAYLDVLMLTAWGSKERSVEDYQSLLSAGGLRLVSQEVLEPRSRLAVLKAAKGESADPRTTGERFN